MGTRAGASAHREFRRALRARRLSVAGRGGLAGAAVATGWATARVCGHAGHPDPGRGVLFAALLVGLVLAVSAIRAARTDPWRWERGAIGERRTAEILDGLPARRWSVLHDLAVPGSRANVDHLAIGPTGVWLVDTKTTREAVRVGWRSVRIGGRRLDPRPTAWEAEVLSDRLGTGVRPVIALHCSGELGLRARGRSIGGGVRVVAAARLGDRLRGGRRRLDPASVAELSRLAKVELSPRLARSGSGGGSV